MLWTAIRTTLGLALILFFIGVPSAWLFSISVLLFAIYLVLVPFKLIDWLLPKR